MSPLQNAAYTLASRELRKSLTGYHGQTSGRLVEYLAVDAATIIGTGCEVSSSARSYTDLAALPASALPVASISRPGPVARAGSGGECTPSKANLDLNDKLVRRGLLVSWHGYRGEVLRVRTGRCLVRIPGNAPGKWLSCSTVQVVT